MTNVVVRSFAMYNIFSVMNKWNLSSGPNILYTFTLARSFFFVFSLFLETSTITYALRFIFTIINTIN